MANKSKYIAKNMRQECNELDCYTCDYFDHKGHCAADEEIHDCSYCKNAFTDHRLTSDNDLSYCSIGRCEKDMSAFICSAVAHRPPVQIIVQKYRKEIRQNVDVFHYAPAYCPVCGRRIVENEPYLKNERENKNNRKGEF